MRKLKKYMGRFVGINRLSIGLALGLIFGIIIGVFLVTHFEGKDEPAVERIRAVERVQLGNPSYTPRQPLELPDIFSLNDLFKQVAQHVTPAVVFVEVGMQSGQREAPRDENHELDEDLLQRFYQNRPFRQSAGSGVIVSSDGYIVTNYHVINRAEEINVMLNDRREYEAELIGVDPSTDLAVIKIDANDLPAIALGDSEIVEVGEWVVAVGNPFRLTSTVTAGIVSALGRQVDIIDDDLRIEDFIQTDAAINPGNSGGALVNLYGELVGISTAIATRGGSYEGYGFAVPSNLMTRVITDLIEYGEVQRGYLGVQITPIAARQATELGLDRIGGVLIASVERGMPAARAGLRSGDVLLAIDDDAVDAPNQLQSRIALKRPGDSVRLRVWREGSVHEYDTELAGRNDPAMREWISSLGQRERLRTPREEEGSSEARIFDLDDWGIGLRDVNAEERSDFNAEDGAYIAYVHGGSPAAVDGLPRDAIITRIGPHAVPSASEAHDLLRNIRSSEQESVLFEVKRRNGVTAFYDVTIPLEAG